ncbi:terminase small subunit [Phyllobacterium sp. LjRoot231]|uniref:terminase small subunit n=1 Tax=Phyllobacterium sp. LjRoot231 TaxID=3342289 RepID=UPI003ECF6045
MTKKKRKTQTAVAHRPLSEKQKLFAAEYLKDLNATQAALRAGYSRSCAKVTASRMLTNANVAALIEKGCKAQLAEVKYDSDTLLRELLEENRADIADIYDDDGNLLPMRDWPMVWRRGLVQGIEIEEIFEGKGKDRVSIGFAKKIKISDRLKRKELIGRHTKVQAFKDKVVHDVTDPLQELMKQIIGNSIRPVED